MPVERIVSAANLDSTRTLIQLGAEDKIVGCSYPTSWSPIWYAAPELESLSQPGGAGGKSFNVEEAVSLEPDVIFISTNSHADNIQEKSQVPTIAVTGSADNLWVVDMLRVTGATTGNDERAKDLIAFTKDKVDEIAEITSEIPDEDKPVVYCCGCGSGGGPSICRYCGSGSDIEFAGGLNVIDSTGNSQVSKEQIIEWNPDIILVHMGSPEKIGEVLSDPVLQSVNAVKNERVYSTTVGHQGRGTLGQHLIQVCYLAKLFHPDLFEDLDVEEEGNEIMEYLYGVDGIYTDLAEEYHFYKWD